MTKKRTYPATFTPDGDYLFVEFPDIAGAFTQGENLTEAREMAAAAQHSDLLEPVVDLGAWRITLLDSAVPGSVPGYLADEQLQLLVQALSEAPDSV